MPLKRKIILPTALVDTTGKVYSVPGLKVGSTALLYGNGAQISSVTVDGAGRATWTLSNAVTIGTFVFYYCAGSLGGLSIAGPTILTISGLAGTPTVGDTTSFTPTISGGTPPYVVTATGLPPGRSIQTASTGLTTGSYTTGGSYGVTYTVTDSVGATANFMRSVVVSTGGRAVTGALVSGDSIVRGFGLPNASTQNFGAQWATLTGLPYYNDGVDGKKLAAIDADWATSGNAGRYNAASLNTYVQEGGCNDLRAGESSANLQTYIQSLCGKARTAGFAAWACTILPETGYPGWGSAAETQRTNYNTWLRNNYTTFADGLIDFAAIAEMQDTTSTTNYQDNLHPTATGAGYMARTMQSALAAGASTTRTLAGTSAGISTATGTLAAVSGGGGGTATVQWNAADKDPAVTKTSATRVDRATTAGSNYATIRSDTSRSSGLRYVEFKIEAITSNSGQGLLFGFATGSEVLSNYLGQTNKSVGIWTNGSTVIFNAGANNNTLGQPVAGDIIGCVLDFSAGTVKFNRNNSAFSSTVNVAAMIALGPIFVGASLVSGTPLPGTTVNFGDSAFAYTPPTGAVAWNIA